MTRVLLLAVLAAALAAHANAALPTSCPDNGATHCRYGVMSGGVVVLPQGGPLAPMNVSALIALQNTVGNFAVGSVGLCSSITFKCGAELQQLQASGAGNQALVKGFASVCYTNNVFMMSNITYTAYGTFLKADCTTLVSGLGLAMMVPQMAALVNGAVPAMTICATDYCTTDASAAGRAAPRAALLLAALAAAAALL